MLMRTRHLNGLLIVAVLIVSTASLYAQRQQQNVAKLKADARNAVGIIGGDKAKTQTYCQIVGLGRQMNQAVGEKNLKKARATAQEIVQLRKQLPEFVVLENVVKRVDLNSPDGREIAFASLGMALQSRLVLLLHRTGIELHPINVIRLARDDRISLAILPLSRDDGARNDGQGLRPPGRGSRRHGGAHDDANDVQSDGR